MLGVVVIIGVALMIGVVVMIGIDAFQGLGLQVLAQQIVEVLTVSKYCIKLVVQLSLPQVIHARIFLIHAGEYSHTRSMFILQSWSTLTNSP